MDNTTYFLIATALTLSISSVFQNIINWNGQQQQIVLINSNLPQPAKEDDIWFVLLLILFGAGGLCYMIFNG